MKAIKLFVTGIGMFLLLTTCKTPRVPLATQDSPIKVASEGGLNASARFLDEATLGAIYGKSDNPFLTLYYTLQFQRIVVFELTVENLGEEPVEFFLSRLQLQYLGRPLQPYNRFQLIQYWKFRDEQLGTKAIDRARKESIINAHVLPNTLRIPPQGKIRGNIVFIGNILEPASCTVLVPLYRSKEELIYRFEFPFEF